MNHKESVIDVKNLSIVVEDKDTIEITRVGISTLPLDAILKISGFFLITISGSYESYILY